MTPPDDYELARRYLESGLLRHKKIPTGVCRAGLCRERAQYKAVFDGCGPCTLRGFRECRGHGLCPEHAAVVRERSLPWLGPVARMWSWTPPAPKGKGRRR